MADAYDDLIETLQWIATFSGEKQLESVLRENAKVAIEHVEQMHRDHRALLAQLAQMEQDRRQMTGDLAVARNRLANMVAAQAKRKRKPKEKA